MSKILAIGGSGFIGKRLLSRNPDWVNLDLREGKDICKEYFLDVDMIIMLAARHVDFKPLDYLYNIRLYFALAKNILEGKNPFVVFLSSAAVYAPSNKQHHEEEELSPTTLYGKSKALGEQIVKDVTKNYTILRLSNVYGEGDGHGVIDIFQRGGNKIYGTGSQIRDYIFVDKVVQAIENAVKLRLKGETFNVSSGDGLTTQEVYNRYGQELEPDFYPRRSADVKCSILNNEKAKVMGIL